jgi:protein-disulfide isomerase
MQTRRCLSAALFLTIALGLPGFLQGQDSGSCVRGKASAPIKLEIFSDFQCPACRAFYLQTMRSVFKEYADTGKVCVIYRSYPQDSHPYAVPAARYGQAALHLGTTQWNQVADALFSNQDTWGESGDIAAVISKAVSKQDMDAIGKQLQDSDSLDRAIYADIQLGISRNVGSTPTFFITAQGKTEAVAAALTYTAMKRYFDERLPK